MSDWWFDCAQTYIKIMSIIMFHYSNDDFIPVTYMKPCDEYGAVKNSENGKIYPVKFDKSYNAYLCNVSDGTIELDEHNQPIKVEYTYWLGAELSIEEIKLFFHFTLDKSFSF